MLKDRLRRLRDPSVKAVILFGSVARGEASGRSDVDLLLLLEGNNVKDPVLRRKLLYSLVRNAVGDQFDSLTVLDMELQQFRKPMEISPLLLNIYWDALVILDKTRTLKSFLGRVKKKIAKSGLKRVRDDRAYYWTLPEPMKEVRIL